MSSAKNTVTDALNSKKNVKENPVKRTLAKLRHPVKAQVSDSAAQTAYSADTKPGEEQHVVTGEYATSAVHATAKELLNYLQSDEGDEAVRKILKSLISTARDDIARPLVVSDELKAAFVIAGQEIVSGSAEGLDSIRRRSWEKLPTFVTVSILPLITIFVGIFMLGLLLALWRFALVGL